MRPVREFTTLAVLAAAVAGTAALAACTSSGSGPAGRGSRSVDAQGAISAKPSGTVTTPVGPLPDSSPLPGTTPTGASASTIAPPALPLRTAVVHAGKVRYTVRVWAQTGDDNCSLHAYGRPVLRYLHQHPCSTLTRLLATTKVGGRLVGIAQSSVDFAGPDPDVYAVAGDFRTLVLQDGTGSIADMLREGWRLPVGPASVPSPDAFSALAQDSVVTVDDAWYVSGPTPENDPALERMERAVFLQL